MKITYWKESVDAQKNACFAEEIVGREPPATYWQFSYEKGDFKITSRGYQTRAAAQAEIDTRLSDFICSEITPYEEPSPVPDYLHNINAVLPWLQKQPSSTVHFGPDVHVIIYSEPGYSSKPSLVVAEAVAPTLSEAAMIALLRAKKIEVWD
jgi:hypothetical protein